MGVYGNLGVLKDFLISSRDTDKNCEINKKETIFPKGRRTQIFCLNSRQNLYLAGFGSKHQQPIIPGDKIIASLKVIIMKMTEMIQIPTASVFITSSIPGLDPIFLPNRFMSGCNDKNGMRYLSV